MSGSAGDSFTTSGRVATRAQRDTSSASARGSAPNSRPPAAVLGQDALISNAVIAASGVSRSTTCT